MTCVLPSGPQPGKRSVLANGGQPAGGVVGQRDGRRHELRRLVAGVAVHHSLVAGAQAFDLGVVAVQVTHFEGLVDAHLDVGGLFLDGDGDATGFGIEAVVGVRVTDFAHGSAHDLGDVHAVAGGGDLAEHEHQAG